MRRSLRKRHVSDFVPSYFKDLQQRNWNFTGFAAGRKIWKVWNLSFQFPDLKIYGKLWKALEISKMVWNFLSFTWEKILKTENMPPAQALKSCFGEFDRKQFEFRSVLSRLFLSSYKLDMGGPELFARRFNSNKKSTLRTVRLSRKVRSQARRWIETEGFHERRIFAGAGLFSGWLLGEENPVGLNCMRDRKQRCLKKKKKNNKK